MKTTTLQMRKKYRKYFATSFGLVALLLFSFSTLQAQDLILDAQRGELYRMQNPLTNELVILDQNQENANAKTPFQFLEKSAQDEGILFLDLKQDIHRELLRSKSEYLELAIPVDAENEMLLELQKVDILSPDFVMTTSSGKVYDSFAEQNLFYRGKVKELSESWVTLSIFKGEMSIFISSDRGNLTLGKLSEEDKYVLYNESRIIPNQPLNCGADDLLTNDLPTLSSDKHKVEKSANCPIKIYVEVDHESYLIYNDEEEVMQYIANLFNQVAAVYAQHDLPLELSGTKIYTEADTYGNSSEYNRDNTGGVLSSFAANVKDDYNGRLAHLVSIFEEGSYGGLASIGILCASYTYDAQRDNHFGPYGMSGVLPQYEDFPASSYSISILSHELGHNFGSNHTQKCIWGSDGMTAIDNCVDLEAPNDESACNGSAINNTNQIENYQGTVMSYCNGGAAGNFKFYSGGGAFDGPLEVIQANYANAVNTCLAEIWYADTDGDGFGGQEALPCGIRFGGVSNNFDANDDNPNINPNAKEICGNGADENGNGVVDEPNLALSFDGEEDENGVIDEVNFGNSLGNFGTGNFTIEMRIKTTVRDRFILSKRLTCDAENSFWEIGVSPDGNIRITPTSGGQASFYEPQNYFVADGNWHHIAIVREGEQLRFYIDGENRNGGFFTIDVNLNNNADLIIGSHICNQFGNKSFSGSIDELRIWNVARSSASINELKDATIPANQDGLLAYYDFNNPSASGGNSNDGKMTLVDRTGNNNGTLSGFALEGTASNWVEDSGNGITSEECETEACPEDSDEDGVCDDEDNCPNTPNADQADSDGNGIGDVCEDSGCESDMDEDGICDEEDNCPNTANPNQEDSNENGIGDACEDSGCEADADEDGICDADDNCPALANTDQADNDMDGMGDLCDEDDDNDGFNDEDDAFPFDASESMDSDGDGIGNNADNCPDTANADQGDSDGDGIGNVCDEPSTGSNNCNVVWQLHHGQGEGIFVPGPGDPSIQEILNELTGKQAVHGDPGGFAYADVPPTDDAGWEAAPIDEEGDLCWRLDRSQLNSVMTALDFTYFQTIINVTDANVPFVLRFYEVDDGARAYVFNSAHPDGAFIEGGDARLFAPIAETDISSLFVAGEENRIVIVQFDDSQTQNYLKVEVTGCDAVDECDDDTEAPVFNSLTVSTFTDREVDESFRLDNIVEGEINTLEIACGLQKFNEGNIGSNIDIEDNCTDAFSITFDSEEINRTTLDDGSLEITTNYTFTDESENSSTYTITTIYLNDTEAPIIEGCPGNVVDVELDENGEAMPSLDDLGITLSDNCTPEENLATAFDPATIIAETQVVIITVTDASGNENQCSFPINTISSDPCDEDMEDPVIDGCPGDIVTVNLDTNGEATLSLDDLGIAVSDNLSADEELTVLFDPEVITASTQVLVITVIDACGNEAVCQFPVEPLSVDPCENDIEAPQVFALFEDGTQVLASELDFEGVIFECDEQPLFELLVVDNCDPNADIVGVAGGTVINGDGTFTVRLGFTAADASGNETSGGYSYTYTDTKAPMLNCSGDAQTFTLDVCGQIILTPADLGIEVADNCSETEAIAISLSQTEFLGAGDTEVTVTAIDESGNEANCTISLTLENNPEAITVTAEDDSFTVPSGESIIFNVLANDMASDGSPLEIQDLVLANPNDGTLINNEDGTYTFTPAEGFVGEVILTYVAKSEDASLFFEGTGNFYEFIAAESITWQDARAAAAAQTLNGVNGYLVTVTSQEENDFILSKLEGQGWMGGSDVAVDDEWRWVTGPEGEEENGAGRLFWTGKANGMTPDGIYANWEAGEPNDFQGNNENFAHFRVSEGIEGQWNDLPNDADAVEIQGYVVEYGGVGGCVPDFADDARVVITVTENIVECEIAVGNVFLSSEPCDGTDFGAIEVNAVCSSCTEAPLYSIDGGESFQAISLFRVPAGTYSVVIRDANDETCISDEQVVVVELGADTEAPQFPGAENVPLETVGPCTPVEELPIRYEASFVTDNCDDNPMVDVQREIIILRDTMIRDFGEDGGMATIITYLGQQVNYIYTAVDASGNENSITIETWFVQPGDAPEIVSTLGDVVNDVLNVCGEYSVDENSLGLTITDDCSSRENIDVNIQIFSEYEPRIDEFTLVDAITESGTYTIIIIAIDEVGNKGFKRIDLELELNPSVITVTAADDSFSVPAGESIVFNVLANDMASDGSALEVQDLVLVNPADGTLTNNGDGTYTFTPAEGFVGNVALTYIAKSEDASLFFEETGNFYEFVPLLGTTETVFSENFAGGIPEDWTAVEIQGDGQATANWFWTNSGPSGDFATDPIASTSASDGWVLFDSDLNCSFQNQEAWLISPELNAADLETVTLQFETYYRSFDDRPTIEVSTDLENWTSFEVFPDAEANAFGSGAETNPQNISIDISSVAAGQSSYRIAFRFLSDETTNNGGDAFGCAYSWQVDDVEIVGTSASTEELTWQEAKAAAEARTLNGVNGYLATVTSQAENDFIASKLEGFGWMGASDEEEEGVWKWVTGPEAGMEFWRGDASGMATNGMYVNWDAGEPNDFRATGSPDGEDYGHFLNNGQWNDYPTSGLGFIEGYVVEYGGVDGCTPILTDEANVTITVTEGIAECPTFEISSFEGTNSSCPSSADGTATIEASCDGCETGTFEYSFDGGETFQMDNFFDGLAPGLYEGLIVVRNSAFPDCETAYDLEQFGNPDTEAPVLVSCTVEEVILEIDEDGRVIGRDEDLVFIVNFDEVVNNLVISDNCSSGFFVEYDEDENGVLIDGSGLIFASDGTNLSEDFCEVTITGMSEPESNIATPNDKVGIAARANQIRTSAVETRSELIENIEVEVNPNPFQTEANLKINLPAEERMNIDLRDISERLVKSLSLKGSVGENNISIQRDGLAAGVYFISVRTATTQQILKVVVTQ